MDKNNRSLIVFHIGLLICFLPLIVSLLVGVTWYLYLFLISLPIGLVVIVAGSLSKSPVVLESNDHNMQNIIAEYQIKRTLLLVISFFGGFIIFTSPLIIAFATGEGVVTFFGAITAPLGAMLAIFGLTYSIIHSPHIKNLD